MLLSAFSSIHDVIDSFTAEHSGAMSALAAAAHAGIGGWGSGIKVFIQDRFVSRDDIRKVGSVALCSQAVQVVCQTLLMHGTEDELIPMEQAQVTAVILSCAHGNRFCTNCVVPRRRIYVCWLEWTTTTASRCTAPG